MIVVIQKVSEQESDYESSKFSQVKSCMYVNKKQNKVIKQKNNY